jgi:hypothetical protein
MGLILSCQFLYLCLLINKFSSFLLKIPSHYLWLWLDVCLCLRKVCNSVIFSLTIPNDSFDDSPLSKEVYMEGGEERATCSTTKSTFSFEGCMLMWINHKRKPQDTWWYYILNVRRHELRYGPFIQRGRQLIITPFFYYRVISSRIDTSVYKVE